MPHVLYLLRPSLSHRYIQQLEVLGLRHVALNGGVHLGGKQRLVTHVVTTLVLV